MLQKINSGLALVMVGLMSAIGTAHAVVPAAVTTSFSEMENDFETVFGFAFAVLATITIALIAWRYTRKLGNKL